MLTLLACWPVWAPPVLAGVYELLALASKRLAFIPRVPTISALVWRCTAHWTRRQRVIAFLVLLALWGVLGWHFLLGLGRPLLP